MASDKTDYTVKRLPAYMFLVGSSYGEEDQPSNLLIIRANSKSEAVDRWLLTGPYIGSTSFAVVFDMPDNEQAARYSVTEVKD